MTLTSTATTAVQLSSREPSFMLPPWIRTHSKGVPSHGQAVDPLRARLQRHVRNPRLSQLCTAVYIFEHVPMEVDT